MYPFVKDTDYLQLESHRTCEDEGENWVNIRESWGNLDDITLDDTFTSKNTGLTVYGAWAIDGGDPALNSDKREKRAYCRKGKASFSFTGINLILRVYMNPLYGEAEIWIDDQRPSWIYQAEDTVDTLSCDSYDHTDLTLGQDYLDITLVNNLTDTSHDVEIHCENAETGVGGWFVLAGYKVSSFDSKTREIDSWIMAEKYPVNLEKLSIINTEPGFVVNVINLSIVFDPIFVDVYGATIGTIEQTVLQRNDPKLIEFYPDFDGAEAEDTYSGNIVITAEFEDINGVIEHDYGSFNLYAWAIDPSALSDPGHWTYDYVECGVHGFWQSLFSNTPGAYLEVGFFGTYIAIDRVLTPWGGTFKVYVDNVYQGNTTCKSLYSCWTENDTYHGFVNKAHVLKLEVDSGWLLLHYLHWYENRTYTEVEETITYNWPAKQVPPFAPEQPRLVSGSITCDPVKPYLKNLEIPRDNLNVVGLSLDKRVATYAVCYTTGFETTLEGYDMLIVEPKALTKTQVKAWQDKGIKVFCYISYGEEVGTLSNLWDPASSLEPQKGDGLGIGGYASYYSKGGNMFGEKSECKYDRRRLEDVTECAKEQTAYYAVWAGRCSNACTKDWRTGYDAWKIGGNCGGGHDNSGYWQRDNREACSNSACPDYNPVHGACPYYESPDESVWGQDYSIFTPEWPDENGTWGSFFIDVTKPAWSDRIQNHYLKTIFGEEEQFVETATVNTYQLESEESTVNGFMVENYPIDSDATIIVKHITEDHTYVKLTDYSIDFETGVFKFNIATEGAPNANWGDKIEVTYTRKGLQADGVFLDTIDTVDVYPSDVYKDAMVNMIAEHYALYPDKTWIMNRGFTILEKLMPFTDFVMFESFITNYNWDTKTYYEITDPDAIAMNQVFIDLLFELRENYVFNVLGLNYCDNDDDELRQTITEGVRQYGWLSWSTEIALSNPLPNDVVFTKDLYIDTNDWRFTYELPLP